MAVIHELRAKGPLTTTLLGVVALDDALSIIIFSAAITIASLLLLGSMDNSIILQGVITIVGAISVGLAGGLIFSYFLNPSMRPETNLMLTLGAILLVSGLSSHFDFSPLLANMVMGFVIINKVKQGIIYFINWILSRRLFTVCFLHLLRLILIPKCLLHPLFLALLSWLDVLSASLAVLFLAVNFLKLLHRYTHTWA